MKSVYVTASKSYTVQIGSGLLSTLGTNAAKIRSDCKVAVISDQSVWSIYGDKATRSLEDSGYHVIHYVFPAGEENKTATIYLDILNFLAANHITRSDLLVALGGGVVGDMTGFVAATYMRGIPYMQVPTTLLAMVDSSVGGKTAIDLPAGKNLVGAFYQPEAVLCDTETLATLPEAVLRDGCAEIIKYAILYDPKLFAHLENANLNFDREFVICRCIELKRDVVTQDEFDNGLRQKLNLGHTIGHAIEISSDYSVSHGSAVSCGIAMISKAAANHHFTDFQTYNRIQKLLKSFQLPTTTDIDPDNLYQSALTDKKSNGCTINLVIPISIGECSVHTIPTTALKSFIESGL